MNSCRALVGEALVERDHDELRHAELGDQLGLGLEARQQLRRRLGPDHPQRMGLEGQDRVVAGDHLAMAEMDAVELADGDPARTGARVWEQRDLHRVCRGYLCGPQPLALRPPRHHLARACCRDREPAAAVEGTAGPAGAGALGPSVLALLVGAVAWWTWRAINDVHGFDFKLYYHGGQSAWLTGHPERAGELGRHTVPGCRPGDPHPDSQPAGCGRRHHRAERRLGARHHRGPAAPPAGHAVLPRPRPDGAGDPHVRTVALNCVVEAVQSDRAGGRRRGVRPAASRPAHVRRSTDRAIGLDQATPVPAAGRPAHPARHAARRGGSDRCDGGAQRRGAGPTGCQGRKLACPRPADRRGQLPDQEPALPRLGVSVGQPRPERRVLPDVRAGHLALVHLLVVAAVGLLAFAVVSVLADRTGTSWELFAFICPLCAMASPLAWAHYQILLAPLFILLVVRFAQGQAAGGWWLALIGAFALASLMWLPYGTLRTSLRACPVTRRSPQRSRGPTKAPCSAPPSSPSICWWPSGCSGFAAEEARRWLPIAQHHRRRRSTTAVRAAAARLSPPRRCASSRPSHSGFSTPGGPCRPEGIRTWETRNPSAFRVAATVRVFHACLPWGSNWMAPDWTWPWFAGRSWPQTATREPWRGDGSQIGIRNA